MVVKDLSNSFNPCPKNGVKDKTKKETAKKRNKGQTTKRVYNRFLHYA